MKRLFICFLLNTLIINMAVLSYAEPDMNFYIGEVQNLQGDEYTRGLRASVFGFEEKDNISLRIGTLGKPDSSLTDKVSQYVTPTDIVYFTELTAFDTVQNEKINLSEKTDMQVTFKKQQGAGNLIVFGKDYKILRINGDVVTELEIIYSDKNEVTFNTDELGMFVFIYNPYAFSLTFYDGDNEYYKIDNLSTKSIITLPPEPTKEGLYFGGWYKRENGEGWQLYSDMTLSEIGETVYAYWRKQGRGDINDDGYININDVVLMVEYIGALNSGQIPDLTKFPDGEIKCGDRWAKLTADEEINVDDVVLLVEYIGTLASDGQLDAEKFPDGTFPSITK